MLEDPESEAGGGVGLCRRIQLVAQELLGRVAGVADLVTVAVLDRDGNANMSFSDVGSTMSIRPDRPLVVKATFDRYNKRITFSSARNCSYNLLRQKVSSLLF